MLKVLQICKNCQRQTADSAEKSALFRVDKRVYPGCYVENFSTSVVENLVETVEKTVIKPVLHSFHRVFNRWKTLRASTLCINRAGSTKRRNGLHF